MQLDLRYIAGHFFTNGVTQMGVKNQQWGTVADAAAILGVSVGTVDRWTREGRVTFRRLGQRLSLVDAARLAEVGDEQYMREQTAK